MLRTTVKLEQALHVELVRPGYKVSPINIGSATDAYQPIERTWHLTRGLLELMAETCHPLTLVTKNVLVDRDLDLLVMLARNRLVTVFISITTLDAEMVRALEPRTSALWCRVETVRKLVETGVPVGVLVVPIISFINDGSMEQILEAAAAAGACSASYTVVRLPWEVKEAFLKPGCMRIFPTTRSVCCTVSKTCVVANPMDSSFDTRMRGTGIWADLLLQRFQVTAHNLGLTGWRPELAVDCSNRRCACQYMPAQAGQSDRSRAPGGPDGLVRRLRFFRGCKEFAVNVRQRTTCRL